MTSLFASSCTSQTDLENLVNDQNISDLVKKTTNTQQISDPDYGLLCYDTKEAQNFKFGTVVFSNYSVKDGYDYSVNTVKICVDNYQSNKFLGNILNIVNDQEGKKLKIYLEKAYGKPEKRDTGDNGIALFWNVDRSNQWIFLTQDIEYSRHKVAYLSTKVIMVKRGVKIENSKDKDVFSILDNFNLAYPKL